MWKRCIALAISSETLVQRVLEAVSTLLCNSSGWQAIRTPPNLQRGRSQGAPTFNARSRALAGRVAPR
eukprot:11313974-Alexandrium_andersonii.AAC.1